MKKSDRFVIHVEDKSCCDVVHRSDRRKELFNFSAPVYSPLTARYRAEEERERKAAEERERQAMLGEPAIQFTEKTSGLLTKKVTQWHLFEDLDAVRLLIVLLVSGEGTN